MLRRGICGLAVLAAALGLTAASPATAATATGIGGPVHHGHLRISGQLRDGGTVTAAGLGWRPGRLPRGDRLLSFEIAYAWQACDRAGRACRTGAGSTATPLAARRYMAGHADTGRRLRVTETATEVVATGRSGNGFSVVRAEASATTRATTAAYPPGRRPFSTLVNGTPEPSTGSNAEWFQVSAPHYRAAAGPARQWYRIDEGAWLALPASRDF
jgi:hypothetical protein